jgi:type IV secretory pathway component VirB8
VILAQCRRRILSPITLGCKKIRHAADFLLARAAPIFLKSAKEGNFAVNKSVEPPVLLSRILTFVFAAVVVAVVVLVVTLTKLFPLNKTQVFFLTAQPRDNMEIELTPFAPNDKNIDTYKKAFVKEYIRTRNEILPNAKAMQRKWGAGIDGSVYAYSGRQVFDDFRTTAMWNAFMNVASDTDAIPEFRCMVEFRDIKPWNLERGQYAVVFSYFCMDNNDRQDCRKDYTIVVSVEAEDRIKWADRARNPLGLRVTEYRIESGDDDPLNEICEGVSSPEIIEGSENENLD